MKLSITRWTTTLATAALLGLPAVGAAQTPQPPPTQPPTTQPPPATPPAEPSPAQPPPATTATPQTPAPAVSPQQHLGQAKTALDAIQTSAVTGQARTQLAELKRHLNALDKASSPAGGTKASSNANWGTEVAAMDKILADLLGTDAAAAKGATAGTAGATGTSGTTPAKAATTGSLDEATRAKLLDARTHITAYAVAMSGPSATPKAEDAVPAGAPAASASTSQAGSPATPAGSMSPGATPPAAAPQTAGAQPQVDPEAARRHLTAARDTLGQLTKLPAAAQLTGELRTQVGQLIANFNELTSTPVQWRASYAKVAANLTTLLGPDTGAPQAAGVPPTTPEATPPTGATAPAGATPPASATPGAVGTSGTATVELDPTVREKLVEMRGHLQAFEKASGGAEAK